MPELAQEKIIGRSIRRVEDLRFLTGRGRYVDDIASPDCLWGHVLRSPHAHAVIRRLDVTAAKAMAGVRDVYVAADLAELGPMPCMAAVKPLIVPPRSALANGRVRHVGDPVAFIVADSEEIARAAAERVEVEYDALPSVVDGRAALADGAPAIWDEAPGNLAFHVEQGDAAAVHRREGQGRACRRDRRDEQPRDRLAARAARRHRALRRRDRYAGPRADRAGAARHPPPACRVRLQGAARAHPPACARRGRRLRHEELPLSRMGAAAVGRAQARAAGALGGRPRRGVRAGRARPRHRRQGEAGARCDRASSSAIDVAMVANSAPISRPTGRARRRSRPRRRRAASTTFPRSMSTCAAPSPTPCRSTPIAAPASPRRTTSSSAASRRRRASWAAIRRSCAGRT